MPDRLTLGKLSDFLEGKLRAFRIGGQPVAVARVNGGYHAFSNICTHQQEHLTDGFIIEGQVVCAYHEATYDPSTGAIVYGPAPGTSSGLPCSGERR